MEIEKKFEYEIKQMYREFVVIKKKKEFKVIQIGGSIDIFKKVSKGYEHLDVQKHKKLYKTVVRKSKISICYLCCKN